MPDLAILAKAIAVITPVVVVVVWAIREEGKRSTMQAALEARMQSLEQRHSTVDARIAVFEARILDQLNRIEDKLDRKVDK